MKNSPTLRTQTLTVCQWRWRKTTDSFSSVQVGPKFHPLLMYPHTYGPIHQVVPIPHWHLWSMLCTQETVTLKDLEVDIWIHREFYIQNTLYSEFFTKSLFLVSIIFKLSIMLDIGKWTRVTVQFSPFSKRRIFRQIKHIVSQGVYKFSYLDTDLESLVSIYKHLTLNSLLGKSVLRVT